MTRMYDSTSDIELHAHCTLTIVQHNTTPTSPSQPHIVPVVLPIILFPHRTPASPIRHRTPNPGSTTNKSKLH
jgi:hypothetical protein